MRKLVIGSLVLTIAGAIGCGSSGLVPVEGTLTLDDKPLVGATIALQHIDSEAEKRIFSADTDANGRYVIKPFEDGSTGAPPGEYRVMITSVKAGPGADEMTEFPQEPVPAEYRNGSKTLVVPEEGIIDADFAIKSR
jgi:hypothetical protein